MHKMKSTVLLLVFLISLFSLWQCAGTETAAVFTKDGQQYGKVRGAFRHRWWNYYERGLSYADGEFYPQALADLKKALDQRDKDQRKARTYGMHFIDYFPHRELGIVYYETGKPEEALKELELSLGQFPTAKAHFYLDRVRKALIEQEGKEIAPPTLKLDFEQEEVWTRQDPVVVAGAAEDAHYISRVVVGKVPIFMEGSQQRVRFKEALQLAQGSHRVEVLAQNLLGKITTRHIRIRVDREGPLITLEKLRPDPSLPGEGVTIQGSIYDPAGVSTLSINGQDQPVQEAVEIFFTRRLAVREVDLEIEARDRLGNMTSAAIPVAGRAGYGRQVLVAGVNSDSMDLLMAGLFGSSDNQAPTIRLRDGADGQAVFLEKIYIQGEISDESKIESLTINQRPMLRRQGQVVFFSHLEELAEGENRIVIQARDEAGNRARREISIVRKVPKALQLQERLSLTVLPFDQNGAVSAAGLSFQDNLIDSLLDRDRFNVVERERLDAILHEQKLSRTALIDKEMALKLGRLVAARSIITGSLVETRTGVEIIGRLIDTETSVILATEDVYDEVKDLPALRTLAEGMAIKFHLDFPLTEGYIIQKKGKAIFSDLGREKIKLHRRLIVYREEPIKHPVSGKVLGADNVILGRARVTQVLPEMSKAQILDGDMGEIRRLDKVITE